MNRLAILIISGSWLLFGSAASASASSHCYSLVLIPGTTIVSDSSSSCSVTVGGFTLGLPTPWGTVGLRINDDVYVTRCPNSITIIPPTYVPIPGDYILEPTVVDGEVKTFSGCSENAAGDGAQCEYATTTTSYNSWKIIAPCGEPAETAAPPRAESPKASLN